MVKSGQRTVNATKVYIPVFVCIVTRASCTIGGRHFNLRPSTLMAALNRFMFKHGHCSHIWKMTTELTLRA